MADPDPTVLLVAPADPVPDIREGYVDIFDFTNIISPTAWVNEFVTELTGIDPLETLTTAFLGDWAAFARCGVAWGHLAECAQQLAMNVQSGAFRLDGQWDGHAADAAHGYLSGLAPAVSELAPPLREAAARYAACTRGVWELGTQAQNLLQGIIDDALIAEIAAAAGSATIETGVGAVIGYGIAALAIANVVEKVGQLLKIESAVNTAVFGVFGGAMAIAGQGGSLDGRPLPPAPYRHPAAA
jgi:hypothetical protein